MIEELIKYDTNFNEGMFKSYIDNVFVKLYTAVMLDDLESIKHFLSEEMYQKYSNILEELNKRNVTQMYDELNVKSSEIINVEITEKEFVIEVKLISRYMDYLIEKDTGDLISGDNTKRIEKTNFLTFKKIRNFENQKNIRRCPGCGASINVNSNGVCAYCGTTYNLIEYDYILTNIQN